MGVCPTEPGFKQHRMNELKKYCESLTWMEFGWIICTGMPSLKIRNQFFLRPVFVKIVFPVFNLLQVSKVPEGSIAKKAEWILLNHDSAWRNWRCSVIAGWVRDFKMIINQEKPGALLGVYHCPWDDNDFNGARRRNLGLDYDSLKKYCRCFFTDGLSWHGWEKVRSG